MNHLVPIPNIQLQTHNRRPNRYTQLPPFRHQKPDFSKMKLFFRKRFNLSDVPGGLVLRFKYELLTPSELGVMVSQTLTRDSIEGVALVVEVRCTIP